MLEDFPEEMTVSHLRISIHDDRAALGRAAADRAAQALLDARTRKATATLVVAIGSTRCRRRRSP